LNVNHIQCLSAARAKRIDGRLVGALIALPVALTGASEVEEFHSLAVRDLVRGEGVGLPSGERWRGGWASRR
jgi:hypothetical protein